jgi:hypothetical protein
MHKLFSESPQQKKSPYLGSELLLIENDMILLDLPEPLYHVWSTFWKHCAANRHCFLHLAIKGNEHMTETYTFIVT